MTSQQIVCKQFSSTKAVLEFPPFLETAVMRAIIEVMDPAYRTLHNNPKTANCISHNTVTNRPRWYII